MNALINMAQDGKRAAAHDWDGGAAHTRRKVGADGADGGPSLRGGSASASLSGGASPAAQPPPDVAADGDDAGDRSAAELLRSAVVDLDRARRKLEAAATAAPLKGNQQLADSVLRAAESAGNAVTAIVLTAAMVDHLAVEQVLEPPTSAAGGDGGGANEVLQLNFL